MVEQPQRREEGGDDEYDGDCGRVQCTEEMMTTDETLPPPPSTTITAAATAITTECSTQASFSGTKTAMPDYDICRLSFYLKCCTLGCKLDPTIMSGVNSELIDYSHAHHLPIQKQQCIYQLALRTYNPEVLVNRAYYIDDNNVILPPSISNAFYDIDVITDAASTNNSHNFDSVPRQISLFGNVIPITKVMLCTTAWINEIYIQSIRRLQQSMANAFIGNAVQNNITFHCIHCRGIENRNCTCDFGCPYLVGGGMSSGCTIVHFGYTCCGCGMKDIKGFRYRCLTCRCDRDNRSSNPSSTAMCNNDDCYCDLCKYCYENGVHDQTHSFERYTRMGLPPQKLSPQATTLSSNDDDNTDHQDVPVAIAVPFD